MNEQHPSKFPEKLSLKQRVQTIETDIGYSAIRRTESIIDRVERLEGAHNGLVHRVMRLEKGKPWWQFWK